MAWENVKTLKLNEKKLQIYFISINIKFFYKTITIKNESIKNHSSKIVTVFLIFYDSCAIPIDTNKNTMLQA